MTSIDPTSRLLAHLRQTVQEWRRQNPSRSAAASQAAAQPPSPRDALSVAVQDVAQIAPDDPDARSKAFRAYLAAVLSQELGPGVAADPGFASLVDRVGETMRSDPELRTAIERAGDVLLKSAHGRG